MSSEETVSVLHDAPDVDPEDLGDEDTPDLDRNMSLGDHIEELRIRLIISLLAFLVAFIPLLVFCTTLFDFYMLPLYWAGEEASQWVTFRHKGPWGGLSIAVTLSIYTSLLLVAPVWVYQLWLFVSPGLTRRERRAVSPLFTAGSGLFLAGAWVAFAYGVPLGLQFLVGLNNAFEGTENLWETGEYFSFVGLACLGFGLGFETPLVMMALARVGLIKPAGILRYWRQAVVAILCLGALLTPPDPLTQVLLGGIMTGLYFLGYLLALWVSPKQE